MNTGNHEDRRRIYWKVWVVLIILTGISYWISGHNFGILNFILVMTSATLMAALVALFFMHLKYDNKTDMVIFVSAFVLLLVFGGLTASDVLNRDVVEPLRAVETLGGGETDIGDVAKLARATPELIAKGKETYAGNCASCHGNGGKGDGPAAAAFNPKPRDFTSGDWKQGGKPSQLFNTITIGMGSMPSFAALPAEQRWALVHFIRSLSPSRPEDTAADITALSAKAGKTGIQIPVRMAINFIAVPDTTPASAIKKNLPQSDTEGGQLYQVRCASCHGADGQGRVKVRVLGTNPLSYLSTTSFAGSRATWVGNLQEFIRINSTGLPGFGKPAINDLTPAQWQALYGYVQRLAGTK